MDKRTVSYLRARFGDYYRQASIPSPPEERNREFAIIPWTVESDAPMFRHKSSLDYGGMQELLEKEKPRHAYFSSARFAAPSASKMENKGWLGADLVFDLDADHLDGVSSTDKYSDRLSIVKDELLKLLDILNTDFDFESQTIVFSGGRGYHIHVRDENIRRLDQEARKHIVDHILAEDLTFRDVTFKNPNVSGEVASVSKPVTLKYNGGWGRRVHNHLVEILEEVDSMNNEDAIDLLTEYDNIGEKKASTLLSIMDSSEKAVRNGDVRIASEIKEFVRLIIPETVEKHTAAIDDPVTTDTHRLIRIPGSLHGGTSLKVVELEPEELHEFNPLIDAIPETFRGSNIDICVEQDVDIELDGNSYSLEAGTKERVPEELGVFLMSQESARKA